MLIEFARKDFITKKIVTGEFPTENCHHEIATWKITPGKLLLVEFPYGILPLSDPPLPPWIMSSIVPLFQMEVSFSLNIIATFE